MIDSESGGSAADATDRAAPEVTRDAGRSRTAGALGEDEGAPVEAGTVIGRYVVLARIGAGGMGVVYAAYDPELDRKVALKLLLPRGSESSAGDGRARLMREAKALGKLNHPNVVGIHDVGVMGDRVWIAMEHVEGRTLTRWLAERPRAWSEVVAVMSRVGRGVAAAHAASLLHRDLKPDNVMIGGDGRVRVMDFGLARVRDDEAVDAADADHPEGAAAFDSLRTGVGVLLGTPAYMAPEQFAGEPASAASDQFSFCVAFWEALYGERPFGGRSWIELMTNVVDGARRPPPRDARVPGWLRECVIKGLSRAPDARFSSMEALLAELDRGESRTRTRRVTATLGAAALVGLAVFAGHSYRRRLEVDACTAAGDAVREVWNESARESLTKGLAAVDLRFAPAVAEHVLPWIDAQSDAWRRATTHACLARTVDATWDDATFAKSSFCLDDRRVELEVLIEVMAEADPTIVQRAVEAATSMSPIATCIDSVSLAGTPDPPDPERRSELRSLREQLARAAYLEAAGQYVTALASARAGVGEAEALNWPPLIAAAHAREAELLADTGDYSGGEAVGVGAYMSAARARSWEVAASAALRVAAAVARQGRPDEARVWVEHSAVAASFAGDPLRLREADRRLALGNLHAQAAEYDEAAKDFESVLAIGRDVLGDEHPRVAVALNNLANVHFRKREFAEALAIHREVMAIRERALGDDHPEIATSLFNIAVVEDEMGAREAATSHYREALAHQERSLGSEHPDLADTLVNLGNAMQRHGDFAAARPYYERALTLQERALGPDHLAVSLTLDNLGIAHEELGELDRAKALYLRALEIRRQHLPAIDAEIAHSLRNLAEIQMLSGDFESAIASFEQTNEIWQVVEGPESVRLAKPTQRIGECLAALQRFDEAVAQLERARELRRMGHDDPAGVAESEFALARVLWRAPRTRGGDRRRARALAEQARAGWRGAEFAGELGEVEAWLRDHGG